MIEEYDDSWATGDFFTMTSADDWKKLERSLGKFTEACLFGGPTIDPYLTLFFDHDLYYEAGVMFFGNAGDVSDENAIYWELGEQSPYFQRGWMIWGTICRDEQGDSWVVDHELNRPDGDTMEWLKETYSEVDSETVFLRRRKYILQWETEIRKLLDDLGISIGEDIL